MAKLIKVDSEFKKKVRIYKRYLYKVKDRCDHFDVAQKNLSVSGSELVRDRLGFINQITSKVFPRIDNHYNEMWDILRTSCDFDEVSHRKNDSYKIYQEFYKRQMLEYYIGGKFFAQTIYKPLGYAGDFKVLNFLYAPESSYESSFFQIIDTYTMNIPVSVSVRNRKPYILSKFSEAIAGKENTSIMSVASNAGFEIRAFANEKSESSVKMTLVDADPMALDYVKDKLATIDSPGLTASYINSNIFDFSEDKFDIQPQDLIYSLGLYDYLKDGLFVRTAKKLYAMLAPGGKLIIGNVSPVNPSRAYMALVAEWCVIHRSVEELGRLAQKCGFEKFHVDSDSSGVQLFLVVEK
jgi:hypothetical protein